jgi:hypothetical protein
MRAAVRVFCAAVQSGCAPSISTLNYTHRSMAFILNLAPPISSRPTARKVHSFVHAKYTALCTVPVSATIQGFQATWTQSDLPSQPLQRYTPLHFAASNGSKDVVAVLLAARANVNAQGVSEGASRWRVRDGLETEWTERVTQL